MNESLQTAYGAASSSVALEQRHRVLRNTYWLLALSLVPTVLGAWLGVSTGILRSLGTGMSVVLFLGGAFGFIYAIEKTKHSSAGVAVLLGFTFFMGLMLSRLLASILGFSNGASLIMAAFGGTAGVFLAMATLASVIKRDLSGMGQFLFIGAIVILIASLLNIFFLQSSALMLTISVLVIGLFSAFMVYDIKRVLDGGETNYITATLSIYLDIFNVFQALLSILGFSSGSSD
jgi:modulator of FtsH protease